MKTLIKGAIFGGLAAFVWTNISWMALPWHWIELGGVENEAPIMEAVKNNVPESGVFIFPYSDDHSKEGQEANHKKMAEGPYMFMVAHPQGNTVSMPGMMITGLLSNILVALLLTFLLTKTQGLSLVQRAMYVCAMASAGCFVVIIAQWNWWSFPTLYSLVNFVDYSITWALAGFAIAKVVK